MKTRDDCDKSLCREISSAEAGFLLEGGLLLSGLIYQQSDESGGRDDAR